MDEWEKWHDETWNEAMIELAEEEAEAYERDTYGRK